MCSFFRRFIRNFVLIASPLSNLAKKDIPFEWTSECDTAMIQLKQALTTAHILVAPRLGLPFITETDSSGKAAADVLKQEQQELLRVIAYASRTLTIHESRYLAIELEALGIIFAVQKFRPYIDDAKCTVITDHAPLKALLHRKDLTGSPGQANVVCDTLSRIPPLHVSSITLNNRTTTTYPNIDVNLVKKEQDECRWIASYKQALENNETHADLNEYILLNQILYKLPIRIHQDPQIVPSEDSQVKQDLMKQLHESRFGTSHLGTQKTRAAMAKIAIWNQMSRDIASFAKMCPICQLRKDPQVHRCIEPLEKFETPTRLRNRPAGFDKERRRLKDCA
ncbi:hypothetical protein OESDEN_08721 [Oesophagostomum dentatum]|uniref:RNA-directed DNA polymerase n=1 Tax=Oesophagostomum dentatum TaxID=61180 RepID=A0A0B1T6I5_OESDE|nr:hypothetical protein OESDEN_08721 [Oesophagostomum dentatum]